MEMMMTQNEQLIALGKEFIKSVRGMTKHAGEDGDSDKFNEHWEARDYALMQIHKLIDSNDD